jgi:hypothetical protein
MRYLIALLLLAGCATQHEVLLMPRGHALKGTGTLNRVNNDLTVELNGARYTGKSVLQTSLGASSGAFGWMRTERQYSSVSTALLIGEAGQIRCEMGWDALLTSATGVCTDHANRVYDLVVR